MCKRAHVARVDYPTDDTCATEHVRNATTDRGTRAPYTWARPPTCTPCRPLDHQLIRASIVILQTPFLTFLYVLVATSQSAARRHSGRFPQLRAMREQKPLRADDHASWLDSELVVYNSTISTDSERACSAFPHAIPTETPTHSQQSNPSSQDDAIPLQQLFSRPTIDARDASATVPPHDLLLSPGRAPALARATPSFQWRRVPRYEAQPPPAWLSPPRSRRLSRQTRSQATARRAVN